MRRTVEIAGQVENLFGTLDENLKLLESSLRVTTYLDDNRLVIEGEPRKWTARCTSSNNTTIWFAKAAAWTTAR